MAGFTWNLVNEFKNEFILEVNEVHADKILTKSYACQDYFWSKSIASSCPELHVMKLPKTPI